MIWLIDRNVEEFRAKLRTYVLVDGSFDPIHDGHIEYFEQSTFFGCPVACLIAPEQYTLSKHPILLPVEKRAKVIEAIRFLDLVIVSQMTTALAINLLQPKVYFKGGDWVGNLPQDIVSACHSVDCEIRFGKEPINSSSKIMNEFTKGARREL